ncbi:DUF5590 domain-containing protein [Paenibacillus flagellatus]|uniref:Cell wall elongation regulator TseB-like domain-containing protein n=1 Tax=Paenibacillus flagellatus TaxID=2211139 RepID=A0A2V5K686_9BACL|nr:DUF5590 domain-containing protein [Paenibacillus flagellatus]PYI54871.1 hypothetical protein DLM86_09990 [Paenibacillus flagellatus]
MWKKIALGAAAVLVASVVALVIFYRTIHNEEWDMRSAAIATVTSSTYMKSVDRVESFVGEKAYMIAFGKDAEGKDAIAWVDGGEAHMEYADAGISEDEAKRKVTGQNPANEVLRALPGVLNGTYLWEVLYKRREDDGERYYYGYYRFDNGEELDTWRLSKHK